MKYHDKFLWVLAFLALWVFSAVFLYPRLARVWDQGQEGLTSNTTIENLDMAKYGTLPLKEFCVKSSYNSAYDGSKVDKKQLSELLKRGCRFLDLEVYFQDNAPYVGCAGCTQQIPLSDVFSVLVSGAFSAPSPNPQDPLFVQLRMMATNDNANHALYNLVGMSISKHLLPRLYTDASGQIVSVTGDTPVADLKGKIILLCDKTLNLAYADISNYANCSVSDVSGSNCYSLVKYIHTESGTSILGTTTYSGLLTQVAADLNVSSKTTPTTTTIEKWRVVGPLVPSDKTNPDPFKYLSQYGVQFLANMFYVDDANLGKYEAFFNEANSGMVPMSSMIQYYKKSG